MRGETFPRIEHIGGGNSCLMPFFLARAVLLTRIQDRTTRLGILFRRREYRLRNLIR